MKSNLLLSITEPDKLKFFINNLVKVNDIMKKTSIEVDDDAEENEEELDGMMVKTMKASFVLIDFSFECVQFKPSAVPRRVFITDNVFNKKEDIIVSELNEAVDDILGMYIDDCKVLYEYIRDYKNLINEVIIYDDRVVICDKSGKSYTALRRYDYETFFPDDQIELEEESIILAFDDDIEGIETFIKKKGVFTLFLNVDNGEIVVGEDDVDKIEELYSDENTFHAIISSKYFTGTSGMKAEKSNVTFYLQELKNNSDALGLSIEFNVNGKKRVINEYIISVV